MKLRGNLLAFIFPLLILSSCQSQTGKPDEPVMIYTSIYPLQFIAEELTQDLAQVEAIFPPGVDAHTYEPTVRELLKIAGGEVFLYLGEHMEGSAEKISQAMEGQKTRRIKLEDHPELFLASEDLDHGDHDPHFWFSPERMIAASAIIKDELLQIFPQEKMQIEANYESLKEELEKLDQAFATRLAGKQQRQIIVSHAAYQYWEDRYDIEQIPISGLSSTEEPSQKALAHLIELALKEDLAYVLFEKTASNRLAAIVQEEIGAEALYLHNLETLLPEDIEAGKNYLSIMQENLDVLDQATK